MFSAMAGISLYCSAILTPLSTFYLNTVHGQLVRSHSYGGGDSSGICCLGTEEAVVTMEPAGWGQTGLLPNQILPGSEFGSGSTCQPDSVVPACWVGVVMV